ncbi:hypothetical protein Dfri01_09990 [Dyadobacter frigoris]|nr:hypothetical protein Dfri01_09990 [Dyadobacter frigoris]
MLEKFLESESPLSHDLFLSLRVSDRGKFAGSIVLTTYLGETYFRLTGGFLYERFVHFSYYSTEPGTIQFGC